MNFVFSFCLHSYTGWCRAVRPILPQDSKYAQLGSVPPCTVPKTTAS